MKTILVIDDHPIVLAGMERLLSSRGFKVITAGCQNTALMAATHIDGIDMIVCDLQLGNGADGLDLILEMRRSGFEKPTIVYTMHDELWNIPRLTGAGLAGIVLKGDDINELTLAIETVASGGTYYSPAFSSRRTEAEQIRGILSERTLDVLNRIAHGESNHTISAAMFITEKAVDYHRSLILKKLDCRNMADAVRRAIDTGIIRSH